MVRTLVENFKMVKRVVGSDGNLGVTCNAVLVSGHRFKDFDNFGACFVVVFRHLGLPMVVEGCFRLFALVTRDIVI